MRKPGITVRLVRRWPHREVVALYKAGGWWERSDRPATANRIISGSYAFAVALDPETGKAVGMGRVMSDGVSDAYIQDVVVLPGHRRRRVGMKIVTALRDHCLGRGIKWIALVAQAGTEDFYGKLGFKPMKSHTPMRHEGGRGRD